MVYVYIVSKSRVFWQIRVFVVVFSRIDLFGFVNASVFSLVNAVMGVYVGEWCLFNLVLCTLFCGLGFWKVRVFVFVFLELIC